MEKKIYLEILRIIAIMLVIFNHTDGYFLYYSNTENLLTWFFSFIGSVLCRMNVPLFIMITGALLLGKEESIELLFRKRILRIGSVLLIFSFLYYVVDFIRFPEKQFSIAEFINALLTGSIQRSFWYLYLYMGLLFILPFIRKMATHLNDEEYKYLLIFQAVMGTLIPILSFLVEIEINGRLYALNVYVFYLLAGYYLDQRVKLERIDRMHLVGAVAIIGLCIVSTYGIVELDFYRTGEYHEMCLTLVTPVVTQCMFFLVRWLCWRFSFSVRMNGWIIGMGSYVFGIYLLEQLARIQLLPVYLYLSETTVGVFACICYVVGAFLLSGIYTALLRKLPGMSRLL